MKCDRRPQLLFKCKFYVTDFTGYPWNASSVWDLPSDTPRTNSVWQTSQGTLEIIVLCDRQPKLLSKQKFCMADCHSSLSKSSLWQKYPVTPQALVLCDRLPKYSPSSSPCVTDDSSYSPSISVLCDRLHRFTLEMLFLCDRLPKYYIVLCDRLLLYQY